MSRALVLVAGLYVFLSPVVINKRKNKDERKQVLKVATDMNK
jgi:Na+-transporting NADH:ubiquinone oxidoreductase subunit NqrC